MDVQSADAKNVGLMNSWVENVQKWWRLLGFLAFLGFSSYCQYSDCTILTVHIISRGGSSKKLNTPNEQICLSSRITGVIASLVSCVHCVHSVKMRDNLRQLTRVFVPGAWLTICRLQQPSVCLMSRSLSPDGLILLVSVLQCYNGVSSTGAWSGHNDIMWALER